ncbi:MAG: hypothetical protein QXT64_02290 [Desulfurococcaceae archaeon]
MREELVYWEQNGEVKVEKVPFKVLQCILESGKKCYEWTGKQTETGWWIFQLFTTPDGIYLVKDWEPAIGYCWAEVQVFRVLVDE